MPLSDGDRIQTRNEDYQNRKKRMLEAVMIKQATKVGSIKWQVGGGWLILVFPHQRPDADVFRKVGQSAPQ